MSERGNQSQRSTKQKLKLPMQKLKLKQAKAEMLKS